MSTAEREARLRRMFEENSMRVLAYSYRHVGDGTAQDVVSEVFLVAWRRLDEVPADALPWLLVVARNTIKNRRRTTVREHRLIDRLATWDKATTASDGADDVVLARQDMLAALADLSSAEREALLLTGWDGLSAAQAAEVAGCSRRAFELRLNRARRRLRRVLAAEDDEARSPRRAGLHTEVLKETTS